MSSHANISDIPFDQKSPHSEKARNEVILIEDVEGSGTETEDNAQYEVEKVLKQRKKGGMLHYLVKWLSYGNEDITWDMSGSLRKT